MEGPASLGSLADGRMDELACRVVAANAQSFVVRAFPSYVRTRVRFMAERTLIRWSVAISLGELTIIKLSVYEHLLCI